MSPTEGYPTSFAVRLWAGTMDDLRRYVADVSDAVARAIKTVPGDPTYTIIPCRSGMREHLFALSAEPGARLRAEVSELDGGGI